MTQRIPEGFHTVSPHLVVRDAAKAIDFYKQAFGAEVTALQTMPDGGLVMHCTLKIGNSMVMLCDEMPMMDRWVSPQKLGGTSVCLHIYAEDADKVYEKAVAAGATPTMPIMDTFWGARYGKVADPFGHEWSIGHQIKEMTPEEVEQGAAEFFSNMPG